jgi:hypothetical protein
VSSDVGQRLLGDAQQLVLRCERKTTRRTAITLEGGQQSGLDTEVRDVFLEDLDERAVRVDPDAESEDRLADLGPQRPGGALQVGKFLTEFLLPATRRQLLRRLDLRG